MKAAACLVAWAGCALAAAAQEPSEQARLAAERAAVESRHAERAQACQQEFFVTACLDAAQKERRTALDHVRVRQQALDDAERRRRAADRMRRIHEKVGAQSAAAAATPRPLREPKPRPVAVPASGVAGAARPESAEAASAAASAAKPPERSTAQAAQAERARRKQAAEHREAVEKRRSERAAKRERAAPLPVPPASAVGAKR